MGWRWWWWRWSLVVTGRSTVDGVKVVVVVVVESGVS